jgi:hypothetical protein
MQRLDAGVELLAAGLEQSVFGVVVRPREPRVRRQGRVEGLGDFAA